MKRYLILFTITFLVPYFSQAQDLVDALRYSQIQVQGTARAGGMGNAFGALGGDFTSVSINPAGIGLYRSGEFAITPKSNHTKIESSYWGATTDDTNYKFTLNNLSYVSTIPTKATSEAGMISVNIGLGYNRMKDFGSSAYAVGNRIDGSYMDHFADNANADNWSDYYEELAWQTDMLLYDEENGEYWHDLQDAGYGQNQTKSISRGGSIDEYSLTVGLNFNHKFYLGASWGISDLYYRESTQIYEVDAQDNIPYFNEFWFNSYLRTYGYGHNFKFGAIYKPIHEVRLGVSIHTPTYYKLHDYFETSMHSYITYDDGSERYDEYSPSNNYDYKLKTPLRTTFSGAFLLAKKGLISVDYELVNYGKAELSHGGDGYRFGAENEDIAEAYKTSGNLRVGGEYMMNKAFTLRAGYTNIGSAYNSNAFGASQPNSDASMNVYSAGLGFRSGFFFADVAYRYSTMESFDHPYPVPVSEVYPAPQMIGFKTTKNDVLLTIGYKF